ncbi:unnamed protein product [Strongylus vulgaris]|uniref:Uncharacterized protein n=1 Tax=Strongylus vulgaris TaxID=40348 RepID=A0A3P7JHJ9_STRVU|nr:unnamed protein product [Strongylus vulgaris]
MVNSASAKTQTSLFSALPSNTYWCLRTINKEENFLYCEFVTEFVSFYDLNEDPYQARLLHNVVYSLDMDVLEKLSERLRHLRECKGASCELYSSSNWEQHISKSSAIPNEGKGNMYFLDNYLHNGIHSSTIGRSLRASYEVATL